MFPLANRANMCILNPGYMCASEEKGTAWCTRLQIYLELSCLPNLGHLGLSWTFLPMIFLCPRLLGAKQVSVAIKTPPDGHPTGSVKGSGCSVADGLKASAAGCCLSIAWSLKFLTKKSLSFLGLVFFSRETNHKKKVKGYLLRDWDCA